MIQQVELYKINYMTWKKFSLNKEKGELEMQNILSVEKIEKYYGNKDNVTKAIDNISFKVDEGEFVGIMGPSGSGKNYIT